MKKDMNLMECEAKTEQEMRDHEVPWPKTEIELTTYIKSLVEREHDYGTCVYAMSCASLATFYYISSKLGVTGFQASMAELDFLKRSRGMKNGFMLLDYNNLLYPQSLNEEHFPSIDKLMHDNREMLKDAATKLLVKNPDAHPNVIRHWKKLAEQE